MPPTIRLATLEDDAQVQAIYAPYCHTPISFELEPPGVEEMRGRLAKVLAHCPWLVCEDKGEMLGFAYATQHRERSAYRWSVDTSVYVRLGRQRRGLGRALYTALLAVLPLQGFVNAYAGVTLPNPASVGLHEALGFTLVGAYRAVGYKLGVWHDVGWWELALQPRGSTPPPPRPVGAIRDTAAWTAALAAGHALLRV